MKESFVSNVIAVYTATGNSLSIAKHIKNAEIHFVEDFLSGRYTLPESIDKLGIVFPVYCFGIPYPIERFIRDYLGERNNSGIGYIYAIATHSGFPATALADLETELTNIGCALSYGASVKMPRAYLPLKRKAVGEIETLAALNKVQNRIEHIADDIENEVIAIPSRGIGRRFFRKLSREANKPREVALEVTGRCTGCAICTHICPMDNITIEGGKARISDRCISCFACYHRCPENAVSWPKAEGQYKGLAETKELYSR